MTAVVVKPIQITPGDFLQFCKVEQVHQVLWRTFLPQNFRAHIKFLELFKLQGWQHPLQLPSSPLRVGNGIKLRIIFQQNSSSNTAQYIMPGDRGILSASDRRGLYELGWRETKDLETCWCKFNRWLNKKRYEENSVNSCLAICLIQKG